MTRIYTAVVVGAGMGGKLSMNGLTASGRFALVGVADLRDEARREVEAVYPGTRTFADYREMFEICQPDVVCVSTWPPSHLEVTQAALELPLKGILVEKPLADNTMDGREILRCIRDKNLPMVVPHGLLVANHVREIFDLVHRGEIGDLKLVEIQCASWDIINSGIHWLNFCVALTDREPIDFVVAACDTRTRTYRDAMQVETLGVTYIQTQSGLRIVMNTGDYVKLSEAGKGILFRLIGTRGTLDFYAWEPCYRLLNAAYPQGQLLEVDPGLETAHQRYLLSLAEQIDYSRSDYTIPESSLIALELCEAAYLSHKYRCTVSLPLAAFIPPQQTDWDPGQPYSGVGGGRDGRKLPPRDDP